MFYERFYYWISIGTFYYKSSSRYKKSHSYNFLSKSIAGSPGSIWKQPLHKTELLPFSSECIPIRNVLKLRINKTK